MTIAHGRTNCKAERDLVFQGFEEQLQILENSKVENENVFKARLYDIIEDFSISDEEKHTLKEPWLNALQELEERHIRIRSSVFIGLYSLWEVSLLNIVEKHIPSEEVEAYRESIRRKTKKKYVNLGASDYLKLVYKKTNPKIVNLINNNIRELRNSIVHGNLTKKRESLIKKLGDSYKEFCIKGSLGYYYIAEYSGLKNFLQLFSRELDNAENEILKSKNIKQK